MGDIYDWDLKEDKTESGSSIRDYVLKGFIWWGIFIVFLAVFLYYNGDAFLDATGMEYCDEIHIDKEQETVMKGTPYCRVR